jgi:hypothetical protein
MDLLRRTERLDLSRIHRARSRTKGSLISVRSDRPSPRDTRNRAHAGTRPSPRYRRHVDMHQSDIENALIERLLDWPFLFFLLAAGGLVSFRTQISSAMRGLTEFKFAKGSLSFKIGKDDVPLDKLDSTITARLRDLQVEIESVKKDMQLRSAVITPVRANGTEEGSVPADDGNEIPPNLDARLADKVFPMLSSNLWLGRYVRTLAENAAVSEELMLRFLRSRKDEVGLFRDGGRWVAALRERLGKQEETASAGN